MTKQTHEAYILTEKKNKEKLKASNPPKVSGDYDNLMKQGHSLVSNVPLQKIGHLQGVEILCILLLVDLDAPKKNH